MISIFSFVIHFHICPLSTLVSRNSGIHQADIQTILAYLHTHIFELEFINHIVFLEFHHVFVSLDMLSSLNMPSHHIYWFCSVHHLLVQIFQDSTTITDLEMEGQVKPNVLLGIKDYFELAALWFIPKLVFPALFVLIKNQFFLTLFKKTL